MKFEGIKVGETYYGVRRERMGNTRISTVSVRRYRVNSVNPEKQVVEAATSYGNGYFHRPDWSKWRVNEPVLVGTGMFGQRRLATREELKAMRAAKDDERKEQD